MSAPVPVEPPEPPEPPARHRSPPAGWVRLTEAVPHLRVSARYATHENFTDAPLPGYGAPDAWSTIEAAEALRSVQGEAASRGLGLLVYDAYRPVRASRAMVDWTERVDRADLLEDGYIAARSGHNRGATFDLTLVNASGHPLDMGTPWDTFSTASHTENATGEALANRHLLRDLMTAAGFRPYSREWWHFSLPAAAVAPLDVPYGCKEAPEAECIQAR